MPLNIVRQDITNMKVDAVVNTTNEEMKGYSGVDEAIHKKAGVKLEYACSLIAPLGLGEAKLTPGFDLPAKYIIHTRGPIWEGGLKGEKAILSVQGVLVVQRPLQPAPAAQPLPGASSKTMRQSSSGAPPA